MFAGKKSIFEVERFVSILAETDQFSILWIGN